MRDRVRLEHLALGRQRRLEFVTEPRFAGPGLRHHRDHLPLSAHRQFERAPHLLEFTLAPDELRQSAPRGKLEMGPQCPESDHFVNFNRFADAFDGRRPKRTQVEVALDQPPRMLTHRDRPGRRDRLQP